MEGHTLIYQVTPDAMKRRRTRPADFSLPECSRDHLAVTSTEESVRRIRDVFDGKGGSHNAPPSVERSAYNAVVINAAAALVAAGKASSFQDASAMAHDSIRSGAAKRKLEMLAELSQKLE